jgi:hypothetical protein
MNKYKPRAGNHKTSHSLIPSKPSKPGFEGFEGDGSKCILQTGPIQPLQGCEVVALTPSGTMIGCPNGSMTTYRKTKMPALRELIDSLGKLQ